MTKTTRTTKRTMRNPEAFIGKKIDPSKWNIEGFGEYYAVCRYTDKFFNCWDECPSFPHWSYNRDWLIANELYVEDAEYLSDEGKELMIEKLASLGVDYWAVVDGAEIPGITN